MGRYIFLVMLHATACAGGDAKPRDAGCTACTDGGGLDATPDATVDAGMCEALRSRRQELVARAVCTEDIECALIGSCEDADWDAVLVGDRDEAQRVRERLITDHCIDPFLDGPVATPRCRNGHCEAVLDLDSDAGRGPLSCGDDFDAGG